MLRTNFKIMKNILTLCALLLTAITFGQDLPRASSSVKITQEVGLNSITLDYSRPNVNGRTIFGDLLNYGEVWRLGANECTKITLEYPITIGGQKLKKGTYSMYALLEKNQWTVVFNTDSEQWGSNDYDASKNVLEYSVSVGSSDHTESFYIGLEQIMESSANIVIRWDNAVVSIPMTTDTKAAVMDNIQAAVNKGEDLARVYSNAADYSYDSGDTEKADEYLAQSLKIERTYYNVFMKAQMVAKEDPSAAKKLAKEALGYAEKAEKAGWARYISRKMGEW